MSLKKINEFCFGLMLFSLNCFVESALFLKQISATTIQMRVDMKRDLCFLIVATLLMAFSTNAAETKLVVRVKSKDAKFIGTSMAGALVVVKDAVTDEILARGKTLGSTGNTKRIMIEPHKRGEPLADDKTAKFETTIDIEEPRLVTIEVHGPLSQRQAMITTSTQVWLIPGKPIDGDGVMLEIPGFAVDVLQPQTHAFFKLENGQAIIPITINLTMM